MDVQSYLIAAVTMYHRLCIAMGQGRKFVRVEEKPLSTQSLNSGDSFVLDLGQKIFVWSGKEAHRLEKAKALDVATAVRDDRQGKPEVKKTFRIL
jgi:Gelsolin repeat